MGDETLRMSAWVHEALLGAADIDIMERFRALPSEDAREDAARQAVTVAAHQHADLAAHRCLLVVACLLDGSTACWSAPSAEALLRDCAALLWPSGAPPQAADARSLGTRLERMCKALRAQARAHLDKAILRLCPAPVVDLFLVGDSRDRRGRPDHAEVAVPVRLDLGMGGMSDIPPYSLERYGNCVNGAVLLDGRPPVRVWAQVLSEPVVELESVDLEVRRTWGTIPPVEDCPPALHIHRAVLDFVLTHAARNGRAHGIEELFGGGIALKTNSHLPLGTGLGVSTLLPCALVTALAKLLGAQLTLLDIVRVAVHVESEMGVGGGWEDATGMVPGLKLAQCAGDRPLSPEVEPIRLSPSATRALREQLILIHSGLPKTTQAFVDGMVERYCLRDRQTLGATVRMTELNMQLPGALAQADLASVGEIMRAQTREWAALTKGQALASVIEEVFDRLGERLYGARVNGAGPGGCFMLLVREGARDDAIDEVRALLKDQATVHRWEFVPCDEECDVAGQGGALPHD